MIRLNVFVGAFDKAPHAQDDLTWDELCNELEGMTAIEAPAKSGLLAFTLGVLREPYNINANYENHTALAIDVDECDVDAVRDQLAGLELAAFLYGSASDPNPDGSRRVRIVAPLSRPLPPEHVKHCRMAFAELIGIGPGQGVENAMAVSQLMYVGRLEGSPVREVWRLEGSSLDVNELIAAPLLLPWRPVRERAETAPAERVGAVDPDARTAALLEALAPYWEEPGAAQGRRQILRALGSYLAKRGWDDAQIAAVGRGLETERPERVRVHLMLEAAQQARVMPNATAGWTTLTNWSAAGASVIEAHAKHPHEPDGFEGVFTEFWQTFYTRRANRAAPPPPHAAPEPMPHTPETERDNADVFTPAAGNDEDNSTPLFLRSRDGSITLIWEGDDRGHRPIANTIVRTRIAELGYDQSLVPLRENNKDVPVDKLLEGYSQTYGSTAYAFSNTVTEYNPRGEGHVTIGYPHNGIAAKYDDDADAWLQGLGGPHYERLAVWIASCHQGNIDRLAACLVLMGEADSGKSMFGHAVAHMWGKAPVPLSIVVAQFNGGMLRCPILVDEEAQLFGSKRLNTKRFRDMAQEIVRDIELKGKERVQLFGAQRFIVNCNGMSDLRFSDLGGPAVIKALRDRLLVIDATTREDQCKAALARLRRPGSHLVDLDRIAGHFAWLAEALDLPVERFVGAGGDNADGAILAGHADDTVDVWETFRDWLDAPGDGPVELWRVYDKQLCVDPRKLAAALENVGKGWDLSRVRAALAPFHTANARPRTDGRPRLWVVDAIRVAGSLELDNEALDVLEARMANASRHANDPRGGARFGKFSR